MHRTAKAYRGIRREHPRIQSCALARSSCPGESTLGKLVESVSLSARYGRVKNLYPCWESVHGCPSNWSSHVYRYLNLYVKWLNTLFWNTFKLCRQMSAKYEGVSISFRTGRLERELETVQLSGTSCSCIAILWVSLVSFAAITLRVASKRAIPKVSLYFVMIQYGNFWIYPRTFNNGGLIYGRAKYAFTYF
jgi:hypothetical protein